MCLCMSVRVRVSVCVRVRILQSFRVIQTQRGNNVVACKNEIPTNQSLDSLAAQNDRLQNEHGRVLASGIHATQDLVTSN